MRPRKSPALGRVARAAWRDGWVAAWLFVTGVGLIAGFTSPPAWVEGALFGAQIGLVGGYFVTIQRNYRRTSRENLEWELARVKDLELRTIARGSPVLGDEALTRIRASQRQLESALRDLS